MKTLELSKTSVVLDNINTRKDILIKRGSGIYNAYSTDENVADVAVKQIPL